MKTVSHIVAATLLTAGVASANEEIRFDRQDTNRDGYLSQNEWRNAQVDVSFQDVDRNNDGVLTEQELRQSGQVKLHKAKSGSSGMEHSHNGRAENVSFARIDANGDNRVSENEWQDAKVNVDFREVDRDQDSYISQDELRQSDRVKLQRTGRQDGKRSFQDTDSDRDQRVSRQEAEEAGHDYVVMYFEPLDMNRDNYLDEEEWSLSSQRNDASGNRNNANAQRTAEQMDRDRDNYISEAEASADDYVISHFETWDTDRDGYVDVTVVERALVDAGRQQQDQQQDQQQESQNEQNQR